MRVLLVLLLGMTAALSGCESLSKPDGLLARSGEVLENQRQRLAELAGSLTGDPQEQQRHAEVEALFDQQYIDPLTRYLNAHSGDAAYAPYLSLVRDERQQRCSAIADRYAVQAPSPAALQRLKGGYNFSCPDVVSAFAQRLDSLPADATALPDAEQRRATAKPAASSQPASDDAKNCYLLFSIKNLQQAATPCLAAATQGDAKAEHHMAVIEQTANNQNEALRWARRSAEAGDAAGQLLLAKMLSAAGEQEQAFGWLQKSAGQNQREANYLLAQAYQQGKGTRTNFPQSQIHLQRAASAGHVPAMLQLASQQKGSAGARHWLKEAARKNSAEAQYQLGMDYLKGSSGDIDLQEAYVWLSLSLVNGDNRGKGTVEKLAGQLSAQELTQAQSRIHSGLNGI
ncbi:tetratricopeptide repeat protein [Halopseudomonas sp.]|uniref:tetratricopeptide repeat protein n=1 Tax=Halopseudomonas sp. TaxID=2901191 RepID=UPI003002F35A